MIVISRSFIKNNKKLAGERMEELNFNNWFKGFLEEKRLSKKDIEFENKHFFYSLPVNSIQQFLSSKSEKQQEKVKSKLLELSFCNMSTSHFLEHLGKWIITGEGELTK